MLRFQDQDFEVLRAQCLSNKQLFCDPTFPAGPSSLGSDPKTSEEVVWKRPGEICSNPQFTIKEATRTDICQGELGDCWLLAAIASLTLEKEILDRTIFPQQNFKENYAGIFRFQLFHYGKLVQVVIDDLLPTKKGKLLFVHSADKNEFWSALLEKAYAKLNGSYQALKGGQTKDALMDFTGGIGENYKMTKAPQNLFSIMKRALSRGAMLGTSISPEGLEEAEKKTKEGLVKKHAYSITGIQEVLVNQNPVELLRLRNPWGHKEWTGAWSDNSSEWDQVQPELRAKLTNVAEDGEFWMSYADFKQHFSKVHICNLTPEPPCTNYTQFEGCWKVGSTAGGCMNLGDPESFCMNPQFMVQLDVDSDGDQHCSVLVSLMQKDYYQAKLKGNANRIGVEIYKLPDKYKGQSSVCLKPTELLGLNRMGITSFRWRREVCGRFKLPLGVYLLIPCTFEPNKEGSFLLRVFSEK